MLDSPNQEVEMTEPSQRTYENAIPMSADTRGQTGWVGWVVFAGMMLVMLGVFHIIEGLVALFRDEVFLVGPKGLVVNVDYTAWGWAHVIGGALAILVGACLLAGQLWARIVAVIVAMLSAIVNMAFLPAYPVWSAILITLDVLVIWAVTVHGSEIKSSGPR
jgi:hypothetical protein